MPEENNTIARNEFATFQNALTGMFQKVAAATITVTNDRGIVVANDASVEQVSSAIKQMQNVSRINAGQRRLIDRYIGQLICSYAAIKGCEWTEAISDLELVDSTGKAFKSLVKLPRMVSILPDEVYQLNGLTTSHFDAATSFGGPQDPEQKARFNQERVEILKQAAEAPEERGKGWVINEMRKLQVAFGIQGARKMATNDIRAAFEACSQALLEWNDDDYTAFGIERGELRDRWEGYKNELIERSLLSENSTDPLLFTLPWRNAPAVAAGPVIEVEPANAAE